MKLLFISHSAELGGSERSLTEVASTATARGHDVTVTVPGRGPLIGLLHEHGIDDVRVTPTHRWMSRRGNGPAGWVRLAQCVLDVPFTIQTIRAVRPDVLIVNSSVTPAGMIAGHLTGTRTVTIVRELIKSGTTLGSALPKDVIVRLIRTWSDRVVNVSHAARTETGTGAVVHFLPAPFTLTGVRDTTAPGAVHLTYLGSIMEDKRPGDAVDAARSAFTKGADVRLDLYGTGSESDTSDLHARIRASGLGARVAHRGQADGPGTVLADTDILLMTSTAESFGFVTVEALMAGVPVIGYRAGGTVETLRHGGGILVDPNPTAAASAIVDVVTTPGRLDDLRRQAVHAGEQWARLRPNDTMVDIIEQVGTRR